jgi:RNA polymerase sigma factor (sigma-70 family)
MWDRTLMNRNSSSLISHYLRHLASTPQPGAQSDGYLLEQIIVSHDAKAFQLLVARHGPMVLGTCRRILRHEQDAEDAFQATFLILFRKAGSIRRSEVLGTWLHRIAFRVALLAKKQAGKRATQAILDDVPAGQAVSELVWRDLRPVLDAEIDRLPIKYRAPFILCYLDGLTNDQAALQLGCPRGTVQSRLGWARRRLQARLARRGLAPTGALLPVALPPAMDAAIVPPPVVQRMIQTADMLYAGSIARYAASSRVAALVKGALQVMLWTKIKLSLFWVFVVALLSCSAVVWLQAAQGPTDGPAQPADIQLTRMQPNKVDPQPAGQEKRITFEMRDQPWNKVLEWYSDTTGLPLVTVQTPPGTFTFIPPKGQRDFTLAEITDFLNEGLLQQKYALIRGSGSFTVVPADERIDPALVPLVPLDSLAKRGKTELVAVVLPLTHVVAKELAPDVKKMAGPFGGVVVLDKANQLIVQDSVMHLQQIRQMIADVEAREAKMQEKRKDQ